jgi:hypothetical protein
MKRGDEALNASSLQSLNSVKRFIASSLRFFLSVKRFIAVIFYGKPSLNASSPLLFKRNSSFNASPLLLFKLTLPTSACVCAVMLPHSVLLRSSTENSYAVLRSYCCCYSSIVFFILQISNIVDCAASRK